MWVLTRYRIGAEGEKPWLAAAGAALDVLGQQPGYLGGWAGRAIDEADAGVLGTHWDSVGTYRRALSAYDVKIGAWPFLSTAIDEPSAYEVLLASAPLGLVVDAASLRADDADVVALRRDRGAGE